ncbi:MAG TPA: hypothetical protein VJJ75_02195 [Candidatus Nanoarchaeia archaeon]|nr:hypothetical protein [Candidatus Nanoarchaeia archaeon]
MKNILPLATLVGLASCASPHYDLRAIAEHFPDGNVMHDNEVVVPPIPKGALQSPKYPNYFSKNTLTDRRREILKNLYNVCFPARHNPSDDELLNLQKEVLFRIYGAQDPPCNTAIFQREFLNMKEYGAFSLPCN